MKKKVKVNFANYFKKLRKYKNITIDTLIFNAIDYRGDLEYKNNILINNFIIVKSSDLLKYNVFLRNLKSKNIYLLEKTDNNGLNIPAKVIFKYKLKQMYLNWSPEDNKTAGIEEININYSNKIYNIPLKNKELKKIYISKYDDENLDIKVEHINSDITYRVNNTNMSEFIDYIYFTEDNLKNGELDLTKYNDFSVISLKDINIDTLIINKKDIYKLNDTEIFENVFVNNIKIIDDNEMKLNPITIISINDKINIFEKYIISDNSDILIYLDSNNKINVFDKKEILKDETVEKVEFIANTSDYVVLYKLKNKYIIVIDGKEYNITKLLLYYFRENIYKYSSKSIMINNFLYNNIPEFIKITNILKTGLSTKNFILLFNDYINFKDNLKKLYSVGFKYEYLLYLHQKGFDGTIFTMCRDNFDINKYKESEIEELNILAKKYVKK